MVVLYAQKVLCHAPFRAVEWGVEGTIQHFTAHGDCKTVEKGQKIGLKWQKWGVGEGLIYIRLKQLCSGPEVGIFNLVKPVSVKNIKLNVKYS